jgi:hypothetical protein
MVKQSGGVDIDLMGLRGELWRQEICNYYQYIMYGVEYRPFVTIRAPRHNFHLAENTKGGYYTQSVV